MRYYKLIYDYERDDNYVYCNAASIHYMLRMKIVQESGKQLRILMQAMNFYQKMERK
ncbi:hypothetical protein [Bovifimicola ammoniilytica]|uniref:hypothetical protein n=1 Tax=Bovifimicola ammoniilytica TaxID=2981720 RepID=UPI0021CEE53C|nr:hypothetical protein [Bovifimicola ammoniilytica]MCU6752726.1 hypothetical protein [Bovifimicola ammoniilytica]